MFNRKKAFTLIEVLAVTMLLAFFLIGFYEGSQRMTSAVLLQQNRIEALLQSRRIGNLWRSGGSSVISGLTGGNFLNGIAYTISKNSLPENYNAGGASLTKLALTIGWKEPDPNSDGFRYQNIKDVYFQY